MPKPPPMDIDFVSFQALINTAPQTVQLRANAFERNKDGPLIASFEEIHVLTSAQIEL